jgi:RES domain-containing protein
MLSEPKLTEALKYILTSPLEGTLFRIIAAKYITTALSAIGSTKYGGRYNPKSSFEALYLSFLDRTALAEINGYSTTAPELKKMRQAPRTILSVDYKLASVLDLTVESNQQILKTDLEELSLEWRMEHLSYGRNTATQVLGEAVYALGSIQALKVPSVKDPGYANMVLFPDRITLDPSSFIEVYDPFGLVKARFP